MGIDQVNSGKFKNTFCSVRPPGHHAESNKAMGFCIYNNVAVGASYLLHRYKYNKVAIVDYDVHHGMVLKKFFITIQCFIYLHTSISILSRYRIF